MRVLLTSPALFGDDGVYGGGERYATELARAVAARLGAATLYAAGRSDEDRRDGPLTVVVRRPWLHVRRQAHNPFPRGLWRAVAQADVVHCFQQHIVLTSAALAMARVRRIPRFVTDLGGGGWDISGYVDTTAWCTGLLHLSRYAAAAARREADSRDAVLYGGSGTVAARPADGRTVLFVGRLLPHKGADVLVEAAEPGWDVVLCGRSYDPRYLTDLRALAAGKQVSFLLSASDRQLEGAYARAAVVVVPSVSTDRYGGTTAVTELLGLVAIEAMSRGIPVVASRVASLPEIVDDGVTGLLVPPADATTLREAVRGLLADPIRGAAMGQAARRRVAERFTWSAAAEVAIAAYTRACGRGA
ncbi:MAG: glycosyltransferase family 4 protein [Gemmatimonadales bacterium]